MASGQDSHMASREISTQSKSNNPSSLKEGEPSFSIISRYSYPVSAIIYTVFLVSICMCKQTSLVLDTSLRWLDPDRSSFESSFSVLILHPVAYFLVVCTINCTFSSSVPMVGLVIRNVCYGVSLYCNFRHLCIGTIWNCYH